MVVVHLLENNLASSSWSYFHISRQRCEKHFLLTLIWGIVPYLGTSWPLFGTMCSLFGIVKFRANPHTPYWPIIPRILPYVMEISWPNTLAGEDVAKKKKNDHNFDSRKFRLSSWKEVSCLIPWTIHGVYTLLWQLKWKSLPKNSRESNFKTCYRDHVNFTTPSNERPRLEYLPDS